jgi:Tol biopolymer transport system component
MTRTTFGVSVLILAHAGSLACAAPTDSSVRAPAIVVDTARTDGRNTSPAKRSAAPVAGALAVVNTGAMPAGRLVFPMSVGRRGASRLYSMRTDGTELTPLTPAGESDFAPAWSPDGSLIVYVNFSEHALGEVTVVRADGSGSRELATGSSPVWLADGRIAYECGWPSGAGSWSTGVCTVDANGANPTVMLARALSDDDIGFTVSPGGNWIAFERMVDNSDSDDHTRPILPTNLYVMRRDGTGARRLTSTDSSTTNELSATWSPDGRRIAFLSMSLGVVVADADGGRLRSITPSNGKLWRGANDPVWSPDGTRILWVGDDGFCYITNADGSGPIQRVKAAFPKRFEPFGPMSWSSR